MIDTNALAMALRQAEEALAVDERGHLPLAQRRAVWAALGADSEGHRARTQLAITGTRRALPIWERLWPANWLPHYLLELAERVCRGEIDGATLTEIRGQTETELDNISWASADKSAVAVGRSEER